MNKLKILGLAALVAGSLAVAANAAKNPSLVDVPKTYQGEQAYPQNAGSRYAFDSSTSEMLVCSGRCMLYGLILNTGPVTSAVTIRDSSVEESAPFSNIVMRHKFMLANSSPGNNPVPFPILFSNGITVKLNAASTDENVTVLYRDLD